MIWPEGIFNFIPSAPFSTNTRDNVFPTDFSTCSYPADAVIVDSTILVLGADMTGVELPVISHSHYTL
ncbi:MAG: hypothetical protein FWG02_01375 [Holophagaceae bacterium]|nr:hypothetical protein [Holophagaceae bacterium]